MSTDRRIVSVLSAVLLAACQVGTTLPDEGTEPGTEPGTDPGLGMPDGCFEDHREPVADPSVAPEGFDRSADEVIAELVGDWVGTGTDVDGNPHPLSFVIAHDGGPIEAVYLVYRSSGGDTGIPLGEPDSTVGGCEPHYAYGVLTSLDVPDLVGGEGVGSVGSAGGWDTSFVAETPLDEVTGDLAPGFDPAEWDRTTLSSAFSRAPDGSARLDVSWSGANEADASQAATGGTTGTVSTGTIEPSGIYETVLGADVTRLEG